MARSTPHKLAIERILNHPPEKVWRALTQPHLVREWLLEGDFRAERGHSFSLEAGFGQIQCKVIEVEPGIRLSYTWEAFGLQSVVTWTLKKTGNATILTMEQTGFRPDQAQAYGGAHAGWKRFIDNLDVLLKAQE